MLGGTKVQYTKNPNPWIAMCNIWGHPEHEYEQQGLPHSPKTGPLVPS